MEVLKVRDFFKSALKDIKKALEEIPSVQVSSQDEQ